jgi:heat shock protein HslJ
MSGFILLASTFFRRREKAMKIKIIPVALVTMGLFLVAPSGLLADPHDDTNEANLERSEWLAVKVDGTDAADRVNSTIRFTATGRFTETGKAEGNSGCHGYKVNITFEGNKINLGKISATEGKCGIQEEDAAKKYLAALEKVKIYLINYNVLRLYDDDVKEVIKFRRLGSDF